MMVPPANTRQRRSGFPDLALGTLGMLAHGTFLRAERHGVGAAAAARPDVVGGHGLRMVR